MAHRDQQDIVRSILEIVYNGNIESRFRNYMNKTRVGYLTGLTHSQITIYLDELIERSLLEMIDFKPHSYYEITERRRRCLELFRELDEDLRQQN